MAIKERIRKTFIDTTDLDMAHQEIGYLKDLCDAKDNVIAYQKELMNIQSESLKDMRKQLEKYEELKKEIDEIKENGKKGKKETKKENK